MLAGVLLAPTLIILALFIAYPFVLGIWLAVTDKVVGRPGNFVGLENFRVNLDDTIFLRAFRNTFVYTFIATFFKLALGMVAALLLNHHFRFKRIVRAGMLLPWIIPTVLSTLAWQWMFDATFSVFNWMLLNAGLISKRILWLGDGVTGDGVSDRGERVARHAVLRHHAPGRPADRQPRPPRGGGDRRGQRLAAVLARDAAADQADHAGGRPLLDDRDLRRLPAHLRPHARGPYSSTHVFGTYAYEIAMRAAKLGQGASISLSLFPFLLVVIVFQLWYIRRSD